MDYFPLPFSCFSISLLILLTSYKGIQGASIHQGRAEEIVVSLIHAPASPQLEQVVYILGECFAVIVVFVLINEDIRRHALVHSVEGTVGHSAEA